MTIVDIMADATRRLFTLLGIPDHGAVDEILAPLAEDIQLAYTHWVAFQ